MPQRYLDPKTDLTFKQVFCKHPELAISLLNALLPFNMPDEEIESLEYLSPMQMPNHPLHRHDILNVRCRNRLGKHFIVDIQTIWSKEYTERISFGNNKAFVKIFEHSKNYELLEPVYSLNLVNDIFEKDIPEYYHYYRMVHEMYSDKVIDGLHLVFVELPKFKPHNFSEKKMQVLWLRYLTEIEEKTRNVPQELLDNPDINKALTVVEESAYSDAQLLGYDKFWDIIRTEKTLYNGALRKGYSEGMEKGREEEKLKTIESMLAEHLPIDVIAKCVRLTVEEIKDILNKQ